MALYGDRVAVIPVGISCQVAHQVYMQAGLIGELTGDAKLENRAGPFDWTISEPRGVAMMVADGVTFPRDPAAMKSVPYGPDSAKPYWPARRTFFWHVKGALTDHRRALEKAMEAEQRLFGLVPAAQRRVFILSNAQNNLEAQAKEVGGFAFILEPKGVRALQDALLARFGPSEMYVVTRPGKHRLQGWPGLFELEPDRSNWEGDSRQWRGVLEQIFR